MSDAISDLADVLGDCPGLKISFSRNCVSGIVGDACQCWRCRGVEPEEEAQGWERAAKLISEGFSSETDRWLKLRHYPSWRDVAVKRDIAVRRAVVEDFICNLLCKASLPGGLHALLDGFFGMTAEEADGWRGGA